LLRKRKKLVFDPIKRIPVRPMQFLYFFCYFLSVAKLHSRACDDKINCGKYVIYSLPGVGERISIIDVAKRRV